MMTPATTIQPRPAGRRVLRTGPASRRLHDYRAGTRTPQPFSVAG